MPAYPTIEDVTTLARVYLNDTGKGATGIVGAGRVFTDQSSFILPLLNEAVAQLQRDLENVGYKANVQEVIIPSIPVISGANRPGSPDAAAQQNLNFTGFFNGKSQLTAPQLPDNLITPLRIWQRTSGTNNRFADFHQTTSGIPSGQQSGTLGTWEWRGNAIYWNGSTQVNDIRLRFSCTNVIYTPDNADPEDFANIQLPFIENAQPLSAWMAATFSGARPQTDPNQLLQRYTQSMLGMANRIVRAKQAAPVERGTFESNQAGVVGWY